MYVSQNAEIVLAKIEASNDKRLGLNLNICGKNPVYYLVNQISRLPCEFFHSLSRIGLSFFICHICNLVDNNYYQ